VTTATSNYVDGTFTASAPDVDVSSTSTFDAWGHQLSTTDQDGVASSTAYVATSTNGFATDVASTTNGLGHATTFGYDLVGNRTSVTTPENQTSTSTFDLRNHELTATAPAPISTVSKQVFDAYGFRTSSIENRVDDAPSAGLDDVVTTYAYDEFGELETTTENTGVSGSVQARTARLHDLLGNEVSSTVYSTFDGTSFGGARTTTRHAEVASGAWRPTTSGTRGPGSLVPTGSPAPVCPGATTFCNSVDTLDQDGRAVVSTDAYGVVTRTFRDIGGRAVFTVVNYSNGIYDPAAPDVDLVSTVQHDLFGRPVVLIDTMNRKSVKTFDALGRTTKEVVHGWNGSSSVAISETRTVFTGGGRVDRVSLPGTPGAADSTYSWTKKVYDDAGRLIKTLAHFDTSGAAGLAIASFERGYTDVTINNDGIAEAWSGEAGTFISAGATLNRDAGTTTKTGGYRLRVTLGTGANTGAEWTLDGTFISGRTYKARVWVSAGFTMTGRLGVSGSSTTSTVSGSGWQPLDLTWTPSGNQTAVRLAVYRAGTGSAVDILIDDAIVWDDGAKDVNIPTETAYDKNGKVVASVVAPGTLGTAESPMVTRTAYDALGRTVSVTINEVVGGGTSAPDVNLSTTTTYDALGREATSIDPTGTETRYAYDRLGRLTSTTLNYIDGSTTISADEFTDEDVISKFGYNAAGEMIGYCSAKQVYVTGCSETSSSNVQAWRYAYDDAGRMIREIPPVNQTAQALATLISVYDAGGRLTQTCDAPAGTTTCTAGGVLRTTIHTYDAAGRTKRSDTYSGPATTLALRTDTTYLGDGQAAQVKYSTGTTPTVVDTIDYQYDPGGRLAKLLRGATVLSEQSYNADGTIAWRRDGDNNAIGQTNFGYDWAKRLVSVDLPDAFSTAVPSFAWRLDGLIASRTWSGGSANFAYDAARRPTGITKGSLTESQTYSRDGNVTAESRSFSGVTGDAGSGTQTFSYDDLGRVIASSGLVAGNHTYIYDRDSNRTKKIQGGVTFDYVYDRTDQLVSVLKAGQSTQAFAYDAYGNMTGDAQTGLAVTAMSYDLGDKLTGIDAAGTANDATFTFDALGRFRTRALATAAGTDTYSYLDTSETVARIVNTVTGTTDSIVSSSGDRLGVKSGATLNWFLPDLHGSIAASLDATEATVVNAIRYDAYGQTITTGSAGGTPVGDKHWKFQGRLDVSPTGLGTPLYDMSARFYNPGIGAFTQLDSVMGSAQDPLSMNRFLVCGCQPLDPERPDRPLLRGSQPQPVRPHRDHRQHRGHGRRRCGDDRGGWDHRPRRGGRWGGSRRRLVRRQRPCQWSGSAARECSVRRSGGGHLRDRGRRHQERHPRRGGFGCRGQRREPGHRLRGLGRQERLRSRPGGPISRSRWRLRPVRLESRRCGERSGFARCWLGDGRGPIVWGGQIALLVSEPAKRCVAIRRERPRHRTGVRNQADYEIGRARS